MNKATENNAVKGSSFQFLEAYKNDFPEAPPETQPETPPAENGGGKEKLFTQDELNNIIRERLSRDRAQREAEITQRENRLTCREYCAANKIDPRLLEILDTSDMEAFKKQVEAITDIFSKPPAEKIPRFSTSVPHISANCDDPIAYVFKPARRW